MPTKDFMADLLNQGASAKDSVSAAIDMAKAKLTSSSGQSAFDTGFGAANPPADSASPLVFNAANAPPQAGDSVTIDFKPNILDNFDTYTYHWKFFMSTIKNAYDGTVLSPETQTIIAESGVTDLTINKVVFEGVIVPSAEAGTGTQTRIKFEIVEPGGAGMLDKMFYESASLGIGNWLVMPYYIELVFRGRVPDNAASIEGPLQQMRWLWPIKLRDVKADVSHVGTTYHFDAIVYNELTQSNTYFGIQHNIVLPNLTKFGKAMADLEDKLNADQYEKLIDNYSIPDTYKIIVDPIVADTDIALPDYTKHTSRGSDYGKIEKKVASYNAGTSVDKIVDSLLGTSRRYNEKLQSADTAGGEPKAANEAEPMRKFWRIITESRPIAFDMLRQDNANEMTIYIVEYDIGMLDVIASQTGQTPETAEASEKRLMAYKNKKILNKKYNYIFTGLNDQIIKFDLTMNFSYAASLARFGGIFYDTVIRDKGISQQEFAEEERKAAEQMRQTLQFINNPGSSAGDIDKKIQEAKIALGNSKIDATTRARYNEILSYAKPAERKAFTEQIIANRGLEAAGNLKPVENANTAKSLATPVGNNLKFVSDVNINSAAAQSAKETAKSDMRGKLRPIPFRESNHEANLSNSIDGRADAGRARTSSIFSTALYSTLDSSLQRIKITIKGDPYWLFPRELPLDVKVLPIKRKMADDEAIKLIKQAQIDHPKSVNIDGTDNFIVVRFRTPKVYNDSTGMTDEVTDSFNEIQTFSGIYKVITIESRFDNGNFTQELMCILDPMLNLSDFKGLLRDIEVAVGKPDNTISTPNKNIPGTAVGANRISGIGSQVNGVADTLRDAAGNIKSAANNSVGQLANGLKSNIPSLPNLSAQSLLSRIPPILG